jgi:hypothetical protein
MRTTTVVSGRGVVFASPVSVFPDAEQVGRAWPCGTEDVTRRHQQLADIERQIDEEVYRLYEISEEDRRAIEAELAVPAEAGEPNDNGEEVTPDEAEAAPEGPLTEQELACRWIGYAVGMALGRFQPGVSGTLGCGASLRKSLPASAISPTRTVSWCSKKSIRTSWPVVSWIS